MGKSLPAEGSDFLGLKEEPKEQNNFLLFRGCSTDVRRAGGDLDRQIFGF